jgi:cytidylate kinase
VAHGAGIQLVGRPGVLRVLVTASPAVRAARIAAERGCSVREGARLVQHTDRERAAYLRRFLGVRQEQPSDYDLVVSTDRFTPAGAADTIAHAATIETLQPA